LTSASRTSSRSSDPEPLLRAVVKTESDFDPRVVSSAGAKGLMQLMPDTARLMGVTDVFDPRQNIMGGARYLQVLARRFCRTPAGAVGAGPGERALTQLTVCSPDERVKVVAAYHAGPGAVEKYGGMPPYETTHAYVTMVLRRYEQYRSQASDVVP
jgi:soluble lytic murein transglycosylase-like protein